MYVFVQNQDSNHAPWAEFHLLPIKDKQSIIYNFSSQFRLALLTDTPFFCFIEHGQERWYDQQDRKHGYVKGASEYWASKYLYNVIDYPDEPKKELK